MSQRAGGAALGDDGLQEDAIEDVVSFAS